MPKEFIRKSLKLTPAQWAQLEHLAQLTGALAPSGSRIGEPAWRTLIKMIADGNIGLTWTHDPNRKEKNDEQ